MSDPTLSSLAASCLKKLLDLEAQSIRDPIVSAIQKIPASTLYMPLPRPVWNIFNQAIAANTNFVSSTTPLKATMTPCIFRIYVALSVAGVFSVQRTVAGIATTEYMNQGAALAANSGYIFDVLVGSSEGIDFQTTVAATILNLSVVEKDDVK